MGFLNFQHYWHFGPNNILLREGAVHWGHLAASLASTYYMPVVLPTPIPSYNNQKCLHKLSDVPWRAKSPTTKNFWLRATWIHLATRRDTAWESNQYREQSWDVLRNKFWWHQLNAFASFLMRYTLDFLVVCNNKLLSLLKPIWFRFLLLNQALWMNIAWAKRCQNNNFNQF